MFKNKSIVIGIISALFLFLILLGVLFISAKRKYNIQIETERANYKNAIKTVEAFASSTPYPTYTPNPTYTSLPTLTPLPPTVTPTVPPTHQYSTKEFGPIWDLGNKFSVEMTINKVEWMDGSEFDKEVSDYTFMVINVDFKNKGPGEIFDIGTGFQIQDFSTGGNFKVIDEKGVIRDPFFDYGSKYEYCEIGEIDRLLPEGEIEFCVVFKVPKEGSLQFIYVPDPYERIREGQYLSFSIRN